MAAPSPSNPLATGSVASSGPLHDEAAAAKAHTHEDAAAIECQQLLHVSSANRVADVGLRGSEATISAVGVQTSWVQPK